ncbi:hypothetical protein BCS42_10225 [Crenothrix sp. D3]|nr:hypothetical protein BCS42_10225 [Crenothrix sp. D3]
MLEHKQRTSILIFIASFVVMSMLFFDRIPQDPVYHQFADTRKIAGIANFWNVFSNLPFLLVGLYGLWRWNRIIKCNHQNAYIALCIGVLLVSFGSAYYHYAPSTDTLLWDRLPMTVAFMALFSLLLDERVMPREQSLTLLPLLVMGIGSVVYWYWTEVKGLGDLRPYALVQFLPLVLIPLILWLFDSDYLQGRLLVAALGFYLVAKLCEHFDRQLLDLMVVISGHTLKHFLAGIASLCIIVAIPRKHD